MQPASITTKGHVAGWPNVTDGLLPSSARPVWQGGPVE
jgi:hypothetical protein